MNIEEIIEFYKSASMEELVLKADEECRRYYSNKVWLRGLIEFSNYCAMDCLYCGIRKSNQNVLRYRLSEDEILLSIKSGMSAGLKTFVLQSGEDPFFNNKKLCGLVEKIRNNIGMDLALTLSCGIKTRDEFKDLKSAGVNRYLIRFETSDEKVHAYLRNGIPLRKRLKALNDLKELGYETGSGYMLGLPGETDEIRIKNAILCYDLKLDMIGIGPFIPHPDTPLYDSKQEPIELTIRSVALLRLLLPESNIPATTAAGSLDPAGREKMLKAGANVLMPNITPTEFKKNYLLYPNKVCLDENGLECISCLSFRVRQAGKEIDFDRGDSLRWKERGSASYLLESPISCMEKKSWKKIRMN